MAKASTTTTPGGGPVPTTANLVIVQLNNDKVFFTVSNQTLDVGSMVPGSNRDPELRVGDKIYMTYSFRAASYSLDDDGETILQKWNKTPLHLQNELLISHFSPFFTFQTEVFNEELDVIPVSVHVSPLTAYDQITFRYLVDTGNLESGEKVLQILGQQQKPSVLMVISPNIAPFYLHQSAISSHLRPNIAEEGGIGRENIDFPSFLPVGLQPVNPGATSDIALWEVIRDGTNALSYDNYSAFIDYIFCGGANPFALNPNSESVYRQELTDNDRRTSVPFNNVEAYRALKVATEAFVMGTITVSGNNASQKSRYNAYLQEVNTLGASAATTRILPYLALIRHKLPELELKNFSFDESLTEYIGNTRLMDSCYGLISSKLHFPCFLELIWSYWMEESMMVQGITSISRRFQNIRGANGLDPLASLEIGPLRTLNNMMWGYIQDEQHRLTVRRRAYEFDHHYGITLQGNAVQGMRMADSRSKFIEAFHNLLNMAVKFYNQHDDTTVVADGFPMMNALKEVHMILSEGAHNQYGDLPSTARIEMLMQQYILARPEFREFLPSRQMVAYPEPWMDRVATLNQLHNWTKTNVMHFRDLAVFGEQIILSIRFGAWSAVINSSQASNWAIFWRPQISNYIHAYRAATGVDLSLEGRVDATQPSIHLLRRLKEQNARVRV